MDTITESEILAAIREARPEPQIGDPYCEPGEVCRAILIRSFGIKRAKAQRILEDLHQQGKIKPAWVHYTDAWGVQTRVKGYRLVEVEGDDSG